MTQAKPFQIANREIAPGARELVRIPVSRLPDESSAHLTVKVIHGARKGPAFFVSGIVHGDEIIGVEIIRRLLQAPSLNDMAGTLIAVPIVNVLGFMNRSRYLPDRRDLNRCFPGSPTGPLGEQLAHLFMREVVSRCQYGIDLHSASNHRENYPQIRIASRSAKLLELAKAFNAPVVLQADLRDGSLRASARDAGCTTLLYEAGEALRFDETAIRIGVNGILGVMEHVGMIVSEHRLEAEADSVIADKSYWVRAPEGGLLRTLKKLGDAVGEGDVLGLVANPMGEDEVPIEAKYPGLVIGRTLLPTVNRGDAVFHVARLTDPEKAADLAASIEDDLAGQPLFDEDEIV